MTTTSTSMVKIATATRTGGAQAESHSAAAVTGPNLSDAQLVILSAAAARQESAVLPTPECLKARGGALTRVLQSLIRQELVEEVRAGPDQSAWRTDEGQQHPILRTTAAGLRAIGVG